MNARDVGRLVSAGEVALLVLEQAKKPSVVQDALRMSLATVKRNLAQDDELRKLVEYIQGLNSWEARFDFLERLSAQDTDKALAWLRSEINPSEGREEE